MRASDCIAVVPAAGRSERMGVPKLLLPWGLATVIEATLAAWLSAGVERVYVTVRRDDGELADKCRAAGAMVVSPAVDPPDMRASVAASLESAAGDGKFAAWLLAPADMPWLDAEVAQRLMERHAEQPSEILVPSYNGRRGHPVLFPARRARDVVALQSGGIDQIVRAGPTSEIEVATHRVLHDLDSPDDYDRMRREFGP